MVRIAAALLDAIEEEIDDSEDVDDSVEMEESEDEKLDISELDELMGMNDALEESNELGESDELNELDNDKLELDDIFPSDDWESVFSELPLPHAVKTLISVPINKEMTEPLKPERILNINSS